jgi:phosphotransacetylase
VTRKLSSHWEAKESFVRRVGFCAASEENYFAAMVVNEGDADGLVTGHSRVILQW